MRIQPINQEQVTYRKPFKSTEEAKVTTVPISTEQTSNNSNGKKDKILPLVTAAVAVTSLGVAAYALKGRKSGSANEEIKSLKSKLEELSKEISKANDNPAIANELSSKINEINSKINELNSQIQAYETSGIKAELTKQIEELSHRIENIKSSLSSDIENNIKGSIFTEVEKRAKGFFTERIYANNKELTLATTYNKVSGKEANAMYDSLKFEATKRIFGLGENLKEIPKNGMIRIPTSEYKGFASTGGMSIVPKEIAENLTIILAGRQDIQVVTDLPLYRGLVEKSAIKDVGTKLFNDLRRTPDGKWEYVQTAIKDNQPPKETILATLEKVQTMNLKIYTDTGINNEVVDVLMAEKLLPMKFEELSKHITPELKSKIETLENGKTLNWGNLQIIKDNEGNIKTFAKIKHVFYDNGKGGKFDLNPPVDKAKNIYNDTPISAGETERFLYFSKFFYEALLRGDESKVPLKADLIIGNDWHTGPISAMIRQLTTAKKAYGMNPILADKLYNTPIVTVLHNAQLNGGAWHSQEKLFNILFGEHAATIVPNSHMPDISVKNIKFSGLNPSEFNALMENDGVNPQMMAAAFSDFVIPVSKGYSTEISKDPVYGYSRTKLFEFRARLGEYSNLETLKDVATLNGIRSENITALNPTMFGITNGCDRANNTLTLEKAEKIANDLKLKKETFKPYIPGTDMLQWHIENKKAALEKVKLDIDAARIGTHNDIQIEMAELTDLHGVTENTPVFVSAGRIVDQKGLDILAEALKYYSKNFKGGEYPVVYVQGIGNPKYKQYILNAKAEIAKDNPEFAKRIVFANLFSEPGRFDCAKLICDWALMPSWREPCGLSHKEIMQFSGAGALVNKTGGLTDGLKEGVNAVFVEFSPHKKDLLKNGENYAKGMKALVDLQKDDAKFRASINESMTANFDWAREGGPIFEYINLFKKLGVVAENV